MVLGLMDRRMRIGLVVAAAAVVVIAAVVVGAYKAGQAVGPASATPSRTSSRPTSAASSSASKKGGIPKGRAIAGGGGRTKGAEGLPLGYSHDQTGAVEAATNYFVWGNSPKIASKDATTMAQEMSGSDSTFKTLTQRWKIEVDSGSITANSVANYDPTRGAYAIRSYTGNAAEIYIFARLSVADNQHQTPDTSWAINAVSVVWVNGDWKLANALEPKTTGEVDVNVDTPTPTEKATVLHKALSDPGDLSDTTAQKWMEYQNAAR